MPLEKRKIEKIALGILLGLLAVVLFFMRDQLMNYVNPVDAPQFTGVFAADRPFKPLKVQDPALRMDLLEKIHKQEYTGIHRNIFSAEPPPKPVPKTPANSQTSGPPVDAGPPPLEVGVTFFGFATNPQSGKRQAFFTNGDEVYIVEEGGILLKRFRVLKIGNNTVDVEETASGRHATLTMEQPPQQ